MTQQRLTIGKIMWPGLKPHIYIVLFLSMMFFLPERSEAYGLDLKSKAFGDGMKIPIKYSGLGYDMSPPMEWSGVPAETKSFVLITDDPDAPVRTWTHWVVYDIPAGVNTLKEDMPRRGMLPDGIKQGENSFHTLGYGGPYPPPGPPHRYVFTLYALDIFLNISPGADKNTVLDKMRGHVLDKTELTGIFGR